MAKGFDAPPTLERSGSEHRRAVTSPLPEEEGLGEKVELSLQERRRGRKFSTVGRLHPRFLREERLGEKGGAFFNGKEGRDDFRKTSFWLKGDGGIRKISPQYFLEKILLVFERTFKVLQHLMFRILLGKISVFQ